MLRDIALPMLDPIMVKKTGLNINIFKNWQQIVGKDIAKLCAPLKLIWANSANFATLLVSSYGADATIVMHSNLEIIDRVNSFFGYYAVSKIKVTQAIPYDKQNIRSLAIEQNTQNLSKHDEKNLQESVACIKDEALRIALLQLGRSIYKNKQNIKN